MRTYLILVNALYLLWLGLFSFTDAGTRDILRWWHGSPFPLPDQAALWLSRAFHFGAVLMFATRRVRTGAILAALIYAGNLVFLFTNPVWHGPGFPIIGSGQSVIKYVPMLATAVWLLEREKLAKVLAAVGILLVMGWIGWMKFFLFEAENVKPLIEHHIVFSWMYGVWDLQGVSNVIGIIEWIFAALVAASLRWKALRLPALAGIAVTVAMTTSFLYTLPAAHVFLLKDQFLLAAMVLLTWAQPPSKGAAPFFRGTSAEGHSGSVAPTRSV